MINDIKIYHRDDNTILGNDSSNPRRIEEGAYHIEWHRTGIQFVQCPIGTLRNPDGHVADIAVEPNTIVPWHSLITSQSRKEWYHYIQEDETMLYKLLVIKREDDKWLELCTSVSNNVNSEAMWQIAQIHEEKWSIETPTQEIIDICDKNLPQYLPLGIDDEIRDLILGTWRQRKEERLAQDLLAPERNEEDRQRINEAAEPFKSLIVLQM